MSERVPENVVICIDTSRSMFRSDYPPYESRLDVSIEATKKLINERLNEDNMSSFALVKFSDKPKKVLDFTSSKESLFESLNSLKCSGKSAMGDALAFSIKLIISELRKIAAKVPRVLLISDGKFTKTSIDPLKMARLAQGLNIKIDCFRLADVSSLNILKRLSDITEGRYYYNNDSESLFQNAINFANSNIKTYGETSTSLVDNPSFIRKIAADLLRVQDLTKDQEQRLLQLRGLADYKKCSICFSDTNPYTKSSFFVSGRYCPNCQTPYHIHCLASWADSQKDHKMRKAGTVRCPHCFYLLKIPSEVSQMRKLTSLVKPRIQANSTSQEPEIAAAELVSFGEIENDALFDSCLVCNLIFEQGQKIVRCENCKTLYHRNCFEELNNSQCKNCGVKLHLY
ncbi:MAG: VWA domain-containing protein [Candidatus Thorarchaeota archaeon]